MFLDWIVLDLIEQPSTPPFHKKKQAVKRVVCDQPPPSLSLCSTTLELIKLRDESEIPATFLYIKFVVTRAPSPPLPISLVSPFPRLLPLIKPGRSRRRLELSAGRGELLGADNNTKWIFSNREKQLSPLFECFTFPHSINWLFDHRLRCTVTDKE